MGLHPLVLTIWVWSWKFIALPGIMLRLFETAVSKPNENASAGAQQWARDVS